MSRIAITGALWLLAAAFLMLPALTISGVRDHGAQTGSSTASIARKPLVGDDIESRKAYASEIEHRMQGRGYNLKVAATGADATVLTIRHGYNNRPPVSLFEEKGRIPDEARQRGFQKLAHVGDSGALTVYDLRAQKYQ